MSLIVLQTNGFSCRTICEGSVERTIRSWKVQIFGDKLSGRRGAGGRTSENFMKKLMIDCPDDLVLEGHSSRDLPGHLLVLALLLPLPLLVPVLQAFR